MHAGIMIYFFFIIIAIWNIVVSRTIQEALTGHDPHRIAVPHVLDHISIIYDLEIRVQYAFKLIRLIIRAVIVFVV